MSKTNKEQALDILVAHSRQADFIGNDPYATVNCIGIQREITAALDKEERRGRRKAADVFAENTALKAEIACLKYGTQPQFDMSEGTFMGKPFSYWKELDVLVHTQCGNLCLTLSKPAPQFDAVRIRRLVHLYGNARFNEGAYWKSDNESARKMSDHDGEKLIKEILAALHIEQEATNGRIREGR